MGKPSKRKRKPRATRRKSPDPPAPLPATPPAPTSRTADQPSRPPPAEILDLGNPPSDPLEAQHWAYRITIASMADAARDADLSPRERRKEIRTIGAAAARLLPNASIAEAVAMIKADRAELEAKQRARGGAKLEARPAKVIPLVPVPAAPANSPDVDEVAAVEYVSHAGDQ